MKPKLLVITPTKHINGVAEQLEKFSDEIDKTDNNDSEDQSEKEITSIKLDPRELSPEDFSTPGISTVEAKEKDSSESSVSEKT